MVSLMGSINFIIARAVAGSVPPLTLAFWRWMGMLLLMLGFAWPHFKRDWPQLRRRWRLLLVLAFTGVATYNSLSYVGVQTTTAINASLFQSAAPIFVMLWAFVIFRERPGGYQLLGMVISLTGVITIASRGSLQTLLHLSGNVGDLWIIAAIVIYSAYSPLLRIRPAVHPLSLLVGMVGLGTLMMLPFYLLELAQGARIQGSWPSYAALLYTALFPSLVGYCCFNRGVELIGAARAGQYTHLVPALGSLLAIVFLGEQFHLYHLVGAALIGAGLLTAARARRAEPPPRA